MATALRASRSRDAFGLAAALWLGALMPGATTSGYAEVQVAGAATNLRITTNQDAIADVLSALAASFNVRYRTTVNLDAAAHENYTGSLAQVIARLLDGYDYVIRSDHDALEVIVVGSKGDKPVPPRALPPAASSKTIASQWR